jgi:hypothetical protein
MAESWRESLAISLSPTGSSSHMRLSPSMEVLEEGPVRSHLSLSCRLNGS